MQEYYVQNGDSMWKIANHYGIPLSALIAANPQIADPNVINIGDLLYIPSGSPLGGQASHGYSGQKWHGYSGQASHGYSGQTWQYVVKKGDSMWKIAHKVGVPFAQLLSANPQLQDPNLIYPGQIIHVPGHPKGGAHHYKPSGHHVHPSKPYPHPSKPYPHAPMQVNINPPMQINTDLNFTQLNPAPQYMESKSVPKSMPPSVAKLYIQEEVTEFVKKKKPVGYITYCYDPTLPPGVVIQGPPIGDVMNPFVPHTHYGGFKPFYEYGKESSSGWKMGSKWFKDSSS